jgi:two-component system, CitB family, sensor histidine kinase MalK
MIHIKNNRSLFNLKNNFLLLTFIVIAVSLIVTDFLISNKIAEITYHNLQTKVTDIANITASAPIVIESLAGRGNQKSLENFAEKISTGSGVRFVTIMDMDKTRKSHPDLKQIGTHYENHDADEAFEGIAKTSIDNGSLGRSLRAFAPVYTDKGEQVGVVLVGVMLDEVTSAVARARSNVVFGSICGLLIGIIGAVFLANHIKKFTFGMEPLAVAKLLEERNAILLSIREGAFAIDKDERITMINKEALHLFRGAEISSGFLGEKVEDVVPNSRMQNVLKTGVAELDQEQALNGRTILTNRIPIYVNNKIVGVVATFRDKSEMKELAERLVNIKIYDEALRAQTHEFMNKLHVIAGMIYLENYNQVKDYISQVAHKYQAEVGSVVRAIKDPVVAGFLLGKLSLAREAGVKMQLTEDCFVPDMFNSDTVHDIITIIGNLINNALEALEKSPVKEIYLRILQSEELLTIEIADTGKGINQEKYNAIYEKGYSTKGENRGIGLYITKRSLDRLNGTIKVSSEEGKGTTFYVSLPCKSEGAIF